MNLCLATDALPWLADSGMERGDDDASWPIPPEVPVQVQGLGVAMGKTRPVISGGFRRSGLSGLYKVYQMNSNQFIFSYSVSRDKVKGLPVYLLLGHSQAAPPEMCLGWEPHWDRG